MMAADLKFPWGLQPCFQVYGTKRKFQHNGHSEPLDTTDQSIAKRPCFVPSPLQTDTHPHSKLHLPIHDNHTASAPPNSQTPCQRRAASPYEDDDMPSACKQKRLPMNNGTEMCVNDNIESRNWQHSQECIRLQSGEQSEISEQKRLHEEAVAKRADKLQSQLNFLQEIQSQSNDYWAVPQENQLKMADELEQARIAMDTDYAPDYHQYRCLPASAAVPMAGPNAHAKTGHIRCYCKPTWEGMAEPMSYL
ncbi:uncharacterized protein [Amphiura filiformis]|uniref:uncharacterized protein n=1 Tax=Amphiura filiformis TaxID=82378 RepID=UPI003B224849